MKTLKQTSIEVWESLAKLDPKQWNRLHFTDHPKSDILLNNMCESFNATILRAHDKPIITLVEMVRTYIMKRIVSKREAAEKWKQPVAPRIWKLIESSKSQATECISDYCGDMKFEVSDML